MENTDDSELAAAESNGVVFVDGPLNAKKRKRSDVWDHFDVVFVEEGKPKKAVQKGKCKRCNTLIAADPGKNGTSSLRRHAERVHADNASVAADSANGVVCLASGRKVFAKAHKNGGRTILNYFRPDSIRLKL